MRLVALLGVLLVACSSGSTAPAPSLPPDTTVFVRVLVTEAKGGPVAGAHVCASGARAAERCAETSKDGAAAIPGAPGTYFVRVTGPSEQRWAESNRVADLSTGSAALWIELQQLHRISGRVRDEGNAFVGGAQACAHPSDPNASPVCAKSGADGQYAIDVKPDVYRLQVSGASGARLVTQWARGRVFLEEADVLDARRADVPDVDVTLVRGVVLKGVVRLAGEPVENAQVCIRTLAAPLPWECERTDKKGQYAALREPGQYFVWTVPPPNVRAVPQWYDRALTGVGSRAIDLTADRTIDVALTGGPQVSGTLRTTTGEVVANALVCIDTPFASGRICRETDGNGRYTITTRPETYIISIIPPADSGLVSEYWNEKRYWTTADEITVGGSDITLDLVARRGVVVSGTVKNTRDIPVAGATIDLSDAAGVAAATDTDSAGHFTATVLPGSFTLEVFPPFVGNLVGTTMTIDARGSVEIKVTLPDVAP